MLIRSFGGAAARLVFAVFAISAFSVAAEAQYITYVATNGNDANPCTVVTAPCKTLQRAVNVTSANGTVRVLTPLTSSVFINKSITIEGVRPTIVGQITIGGLSTAVTLRGLALDGVGGYVNGIRIDSAAAVHIEDCTVERYTGDGIKLSVSSIATELYVADTVSRDNGGNGLYVSSDARVTIEDSRFENNAQAGLYMVAVKINVTRSVASGNTLHGFELGGHASVTESTAANNSLAGFYVTGAAQATLASSVARGNSQSGLTVIAGSNATVVDSEITGNGTGVSNFGTLLLITSVIVSIENSGTFYTRLNNTLGGSYSGAAPVTYSAF